MLTYAGLKRCHEALTSICFGGFILPVAVVLAFKMLCTLRDPSAAFGAALHPRPGASSASCSCLAHGACGTLAPWGETYLEAAGT